MDFYELRGFTPKPRPAPKPHSAPKLLTIWFTTVYNG